MSKLNGRYRTDPGAKQRRGYSRPHKHADGGDWTIEWKGGCWYLNSGYGGDDYYYCESDSDTPPLTGWEVNLGTEPPPTLSKADSSTGTPAQARALPAPAAARGCC